MHDKLAGIQYLRAIAAIAVVIEHAVVMASFDKYYGERVPFFDFWYKGALGVSLFFVISGFIIMVSSLQRHSLAPKKPLKDFALARFVRIVPMMWLAIASYCVLRLLGRGTDYDLQPYINAFFLLPFGDYDPPNIWTLRHEVIFYAVFALAFMARARWRNGILLVWVLMALLTAASPMPEADKTRAQEIFANVFAPVNLLFGVGALIGMLYLRFPQHFARLGERLGQAWRSWPFLTLCFAATMAVGASLGYHTQDMRSAWHTAALYGPLVLLGALHLRKPNATMLYLGNASYSIYLFNPHIESALLGVMAKLAPTLPVELVVVLVSAGAITGACLIHSFVEVPLTKVIQARTQLWSSRQASEAKRADC